MKIFIVLCVVVGPNMPADVSAKPYASREQACLAIKEAYEKEWKRLEKESYEPLTEGDYASGNAESSAWLYYENGHGLVNIEWTTEEEEMDLALLPSTDMGTIAGETQSLWAVRTNDGKMQHIIASQEELDKMVAENRIQQYTCACTVHGTGSPD